MPSEVDVVLTEGNYLLLDEGDWADVRSLLDEVWFCALDDGLRQQRLVERHVAAGREPDDARAWVENSDEANARRVVPTAPSADVVLVDATSWTSRTSSHLTEATRQPHSNSSGSAPRVLV